MDIKRLIFLILSIIVITIPRFNWGNAGPLKSFVGTIPFDVEQYINYTEYFRKYPAVADDLESPFVYRPFVPFMASFLPFKPLTSLNIVNLLFLIIALFPLISILKLLNLEGNYLFIGGILFVYSFPLFYYGTSGYIDAVLIAFVMAGTYLILNGNIIMFLLVLIVGVSVKETIVILIPVFAVYLFFQYKFSLTKKILLLIIAIVTYSLTAIFLRKLAPVTDTYLWFPSIEILFNNLVRLKTYLSISLTFGLPGIGALLYIYYVKRIKIDLTKHPALIIGGLSSVFISVFSLFAAYADGRHLWTSYPFTIPLAVVYIKYFWESNRAAN